MRGVLQDLTGRRFGRLVVLGRSSSPPTRAGAFWDCICDCGNKTKKPIQSTTLTTLQSQSCGCLMVERVKKSNTTHGMTKTRTYVSWRSMWQRCTDTAHKSYEAYKDRHPVDRWKSFEMFLQDMGERPARTTLDRIDNEKPYSPENCKWSSLKEQQFNRGATHVVVVNGVKVSMREACKLLGANYDRAKARVHKGWSAHDAVFIPKTNRHQTHPRAK